jgi:Mrp family chromosome partitioning ATPase
LNLALSMARDKSTEVFLIDLDMRNPSICNYLGIRPPRDITSYFAGEGSPASTLFTIGVENLVLAGSSIATDQASELLVSGRFEELIAFISNISSNPIVLIDLPPVLVTDEALLVAPRVDATALVVAEGRTRRDSLGRARQLLADYSFAGVILNRAYERFGADTYYGYGYRDSKPKL